METKPYNEAIKQGNFRPFEVKDTIVICSYHFARSRAADVANTAWDLVIIDDHVFGDLKSFREQYANLTQEQVFRSLKARLKPICHHTLRRQVTAYIPYTNRLPLLEEFTPEASEDRLYELVA